jgi:hypothetical protein
MKGRERIPGAAALLISVIIAGCGGEDVRYPDKQIVDKLNLERSGNGYSIDGDVFCEVERKLLNDSAEVEAAADRDELGLVIASREANVGVKGVPVFPPDCREQAKKKLNKLDPAPAN